MKLRCSHCHLEADESIMIKDGEHFFCCKGCEGVFHLLQSEGLDTFYKKVGDRELAPPKEATKELGSFDLDSFIDKYVVKSGDIYKVSLIIEGIHCSACIWLNEKVLNKEVGIIEATINYTNHKATISYDSTKIKLSDIIHKIRAIGYNAYPYDPKLQEERANKTKKEYYLKMIVALFFSMNMMMFDIAKYAGYFSGLEADIQTIFHYTELLLATPVLFYSGIIFFKGAYYGIKNRMVNMDLLVTIGAVLTYVYSIYVMISGIGQTYFDSVAMIITFVLVGKFLEVISKKSVVDTLDTINSQIPTEVTIVKNSEKFIVANEEVKIGDIIEVREGQKVVIDGIIKVGSGSFDYSALTGESESVYKGVGDSITSGAISLDSVIRYEATKEFKSSTLNTITTLIEESLNKKPNIENRANNLSGYFSLAILSISFFTFLGWYINGEFEDALINAISVIVIACPCALALATPVATLIGISSATKNGLIFKETKFLETMAKADTLVLDKTGTITEGKPSVVEFVKLKDDFDISLVYSLVSASSHPVSSGIKEYLKENNEIKDYHFDIKIAPAKGLYTIYENKNIVGGSISYIYEQNIKFDTKIDGVFFGFCIDNELVAYFVLNDKIKDGTKEAIEYIKSQGIDIIMLTGDNEHSAKKVANTLGIEYLANMSPIDKANYIDKLHNNNKIVVMAGDGINDSIALSKSDIAISMGNGTDVAISVSDIIVMNNTFSSLKYAFLISRRTYRFIKQNLAISLVYNALTIPLAVMGYVIPFVAAISMSISSLLVVANSFRIKLKK